MFHQKKEVIKVNAKEFMLALNNIVKEKNIEKGVVLEAMQLALTSAYKRNFQNQTNVRVDINEDTGVIKVFSFLTVVDELEKLLKQK